MTECGTDSPIERVLSEEDAVPSLTLTSFIVVWFDVFRPCKITFDHCLNVMWHYNHVFCCVLKIIPFIILLFNKACVVIYFHN